MRRARDVRALLAGHVLARIAGACAAGLLLAAATLPAARAAGPGAPAASEPAAAPSPAPAASVPKPLAAFADANDAACHQLVPPMLARPDFAEALKARPVDLDAVCRCARAVLMHDGRLAAQFEGDPQAVDQRLRTPLVHSYLSMRVVSAALSCTSGEMEKSLAAAPLAR